MIVLIVDNRRGKLKTGALEPVFAERPLREVSSHIDGNPTRLLVSTAVMSGIKFDGSALFVRQLYVVISSGSRSLRYTCSSLTSTPPSLVPSWLYSDAAGAF